MHKQKLQHFPHIPQVIIDSHEVIQSFYSPQDIVETHPGLQFLMSTPEFHARYIETVGKVYQSNHLV